MLATLYSNQTQATVVVLVSGVGMAFVSFMFRYIVATTN